MVTDKDLHHGDPESPTVYAPVHAWRALGQLGAAEALPALLGLFDAFEEVDDWMATDLPKVFARFGPTVIPGLAAYLNNPANDTYARWAVCDGLAELGKRFPEARAACVDAILLPLTGTTDIDPEVNAAAVIGLLALKAAEAAPVIELAFAAGRVEESIVGNWPEVRFELGLGPKPPHRRRLFPSPLSESRSPRAKADARKARRKREKQARKRSRNRR
jgi:hypothetical protein